MTEEQNRQRYESFITSCIHGGQFDAIIGYKEWLETTPLKDNSVLHLSTKDAEKFVEMLENPPKPSDELRRLIQDASKIECMSVLTGLPVEDLEEMFPNEKTLKPEEVIAGTAKIRTRKEWSVLCKQVGVDFD